MSSTRAPFTRLAVLSLVVEALAVAALLGTPATAVAYSYESEGRSNLVEDRGGPPPQEAEDEDGDSELPWLFAVFFITWAAFFGYVFIMSRRQTEMGREIEALKRALEDRERQAAAPQPAGDGDGQ